MNLSDNNSFEIKALEIFRIQATNNPIYKQYIKLLGIDIDTIKYLQDIPFLPIEFFKTHKIITGNKNTEKIFTSSGTTGVATSKHYVSDLNVYIKTFNSCFNTFYGNPDKYCILALLPNYLERDGSSLIYMMNELIKQSKHPKSGFYLYNTNELVNLLLELEKSKQKILLLGVTYALLDLAEAYKLNLKHTIVMETGGMKGKRKEMIREELHQFLTNRFGVKTIHSEYGMTELLSQAYSKGNGLFYAAPKMKILIRDIYDPFSYVDTGRTGCINVIDLANINSCSFIETMDLGKLNKNNSFEILGRLDNSDIRGCNLLVGS